MSDCHPKRAQKAKGKCGSCYDALLRKNNASYREAQNRNCLDWGKKNRKRLTEYNQGRSRDQTAKRYDLTRAKVDEILDAGCWICGRTIGVCIYQDHSTGSVRGCLCVTCNVGVGWIEKRDWFEKALQYLKRGSS